VRDRKRFGLKDTDIAMVTVGRLVARKAIHQTFAALAGLRDLPLRLLVVGTGPLEESLRQAAHEAGVFERIQFLGKVSEEEKFAALRASDLFVSTSQHEGFGLVYLEAMACGLPVICYDYGGQTDFLTDGLNGRLVKLNDVGEFTEACRQLASASDRRRAIGARNLEEVREYFIDRCAARYEAVFDDVIRRRADR
jgi:glycosyltransferase involved in cell wall biosynthesis